MHDAPQGDEHDEQHGEAVAVGDASLEVELEHAEQLADDHAGESVDAARDGRRLVRRLEEQHADAERDHDPREVAAADDEDARGEAGDGRDGCTREEPRQRFAPAVHREQPGRVRAESEEGRVAERHDPRVAEDEIERHREESGDEDLAAEHEVPGEREPRDEREAPEHEFRHAPAIVGQRRCRIHRRAPKSPAGKATSSTIISA